MENCYKIDQIVARLLEEFAVTIVKRASEKINIDPDVIAGTVPGLVHNHWFMPDDSDNGFIPGCAYCERCRAIQKVQ